ARSNSCPRTPPPLRGRLLGAVAEAVVAVALLVDEKEGQPLARPTAIDVGLGRDAGTSLALVDPDLEGTDVASQTLGFDVSGRAVLGRVDLLEQLEQSLIACGNDLAQRLVGFAVTNVDPT